MARARATEILIESRRYEYFLLLHVRVGKRRIAHSRKGRSMEPEDRTISQPTFAASGKRHGAGGQAFVGDVCCQPPLPDCLLIFGFADAPTDTAKVQDFPYLWGSTEDA